MTKPLLQITDLEKHFGQSKGMFNFDPHAVRAVNGISLAVQEGKTTALVGESGCGKSTAAKLIAGALSPTAGKIELRTRDGKTLDIGALRGSDRKQLWRDVQLIFQDPFSSLNPRMTVRQIIAEPLRNFGIAQGDAATDIVTDLLDRVGLQTNAMNRYPHAFSGGQRQRIGIARALAVNPRLVIGDEPVSALDVSVAAQILNLFQELQRDLGLTYLLITHDLSVVRHSADRVAVMYLGRIVEESDTASLFAAPRHPYTRALLSAMPSLDKKDDHRIILPGEVASARNIPTGCAFHPRCALATELCRTTAPKTTLENGNQVACHTPLEAAP
ncbi:MAG: oligopeptide/dipeptide ABC transporter ATP-binding protein [Paracoccaceae bacterium]